MKKSIAISLILCCSTIYTADKKDLSVIEGASYYVIDGNEKAIITGMTRRACNLPEEYATVFNASGDPIKRISKAECNHPSDLKHILDPNAPKPHVATYGLKYWPAVKLLLGATKGTPGYFMVLRDKNGNHLESYRYNKNTGGIIVSYDPPRIVNSVAELEDFDTTESVESDSDPLDLDVQNRQNYCSIQ